LLSFRTSKARVEILSQPHVDAQESG
jgi:hypothetical protein